LKYIDEDVMKNFLIIDPQFKKTMSSIISNDDKSKGILSFSNHRIKNHYLSAQNDFQIQVRNLLHIYLYFKESTPIIPDIAKIIIEYYAKDITLVKQVNFNSAALESKSEQEEKHSTKSILSKLNVIFKPSVTQEQHFQFTTDSKGVAADTQLAKNMPQQRVNLPDELMPIYSSQNEEQSAQATSKILSPK
jgi:hypothetical protein